jgi:hypothetical protein
LLLWAPSIPYLHVPSGPHWAKHIVDELRITLGIALLLAISVDYRLKRRLAVEIAENLGPHSAGFRLPKSVRSEVARVCAADKFRKDVRLSLHLQEIPDSDRVSLLFRSEFKLVNLTHKTLDHVHTVAVVESLGPAEIRQVAATGLYEGDYQRTPRKSEIARDGLCSTWKHSCRIPPGSGDPDTDRGAKFTSEVKLILRRADTVVYYSPEAVVNATVEVVAPDGLEVYVDLGHVDGQELIKRFDGGTRTWEIDGGFMPMAAMSLEWKERTAVSPDQETDESWIQTWDDFRRTFFT